jgi:hypothetical protein
MARGQRALIKSMVIGRARLWGPSAVTVILLAPVTGVSSTTVQETV